MISLLFHILLLFQSIRAIDTGNCNKLWGMSNTINNINLYSMDLYMCETHFGEKIKESPIKSPSPSSHFNENYDGQLLYIESCTAFLNGLSADVTEMLPVAADEPGGLPPMPDPDDNSGITLF